MTEVSSIDEQREQARRRVDGSPDGTRGGLERRQKKEEEWLYFEKRTDLDRRSGDDRRSGEERREK